MVIKSVSKPARVFRSAVLIYNDKHVSITAGF